MPGYDPEKAKYLCNPENMRVMVNTPDKRRLCPDLIPCNKVDAADIARDPRILKPAAGKYLPQPEDKELGDRHAPGPLIDTGFGALRLQVESSERKDELCQIGSNLGLKLTKTMNISTMQSRLAEHFDELEADL